MGRHRDRRPLRDLDPASAAVSRQRTCQLDRIASRSAERLHLVVQLPPVRLPRGLDVRHWRRRSRRHGDPGTSGRGEDEGGRFLSVARLASLVQMGYQRARLQSNWVFIGRRMTHLSHLTSRNFLIALHDLLATAAALFAAFYLRFEGGDGFFERLPLLFQMLPYFLAFSVVVFFILNLTTTKWR